MLPAVVEIDLIGLNKAARLIGVHRTLLYYYIVKRKISFYNIDGHLFVDHNTLEELRTLIRRGKLDENSRRKSEAINN